MIPPASRNQSEAFHLPVWLDGFANRCEKSDTTFVGGNKMWTNRIAWRENASR